MKVKCKLDERKRHNQYAREHTNPVVTKYDDSVEQTIYKVMTRQRREVMTRRLEN